MFCKTNADAGIDPEALLGLVVTGYSGVYDGEKHTVTATVNPDYASTTSFRYSTNGTSWSATNPPMTNAGSTTVYVRAINTILGTFTGEATITIDPVPVTLTANSLETTFNRYTQSVNGYTSSESGINFSGVSASGSGTNAGEYPVTFSGVTVDVTTDSSGNYIVHELVEGKLTIAKAKAANLGLTVSGYNGMYDGSAHTVSVSVYDSSGTNYEYSTNNSTWRSSPYYLTNVGSLRVYVRALNDNYETASGYADIVITEAKATLIVNWFAGEPLSLFDPDGNTVFAASTSGYWTGQPTKIGYYRAIYPNHDPMYRETYVESTTSGTYYIAW